MKNSFMSGVIVAIIAIGVGFFLSQMKDKLYKCEMKGNMMGLESWECKNILSGHIIKGVGTEDRKAQ